MQRRARRSPEPADYDVAIVGGAYAGAATALLLKRTRPDLRVLVVERAEQFDRKVGESAIELASWFLTKILRLERHLAVEQLPKHGLRMWFHNQDVTTLTEASEMGPRYQATVPGCHMDRAVLDEHVLALASGAGADLWRPGRVLDVDLVEGGRSTLLVETPEGHRAARARWVVDATGRRAWLARRRGLLESMPEHPTRAIWARFRNVADLDDGRLGDTTLRTRMTVASRALSTNHLTGPGWWAWLIPLPGGDTSVGLVWDERIANVPATGSAKERFLSVVNGTAVGRELLAGAEMVEGDLHALNGLPYRCRQLMGDGWALVGDAAGFLDPFYSPGLDWASLTVARTVEIVRKAAGDKELTGTIARHNRDFTTSFHRWFEALYRDKYYYMGDSELMEVAFRSEVSMYYFGILGPPYRAGLPQFQPYFSSAPSVPFYHWMKFVNRRLARLGRIRLAAGTWGRRNAGRQVLLPGFALGPRSLLWAPGVIARLALLEINSIPDRFRALRGGAGVGKSLPVPDVTAR